MSRACLQSYARVYSDIEVNCDNTDCECSAAEDCNRLGAYCDSTYGKCMYTMPWTPLSSGNYGDIDDAGYGDAILGYYHGCWLVEQACNENDDCGVGGTCFGGRGICKKSSGACTASNDADCDDSDPQTIDDCDVTTCNHYYWPDADESTVVAEGLSFLMAAANWPGYYYKAGWDDPARTCELTIFD